MKICALVLCGAIALSGCSTLSSVVSGGSVASGSPQTVATAEKGLTLAHLAYEGLGDALKAAATSGLLHGSAAATAKVLYDNAGSALDVADSADSVANAQGITDAVSKANNLILQAKATLNPTVSK